jgi:hypothetical protein
MNYKKEDDSIYRKLNRIYLDIKFPMVMLSSCVGFNVGMIEAMSENSTPITSFVNIIGYSFIGVASGVLWPIFMPLLSIGAIYISYKK